MRTLSLCFLLAGLAGCAANTPDTAEIGAAAAPAASAEPTESMAASGPEMVAEGSAQFGVDLYKRLGGEGGNVFISPTSISTAFGLAYAGARGETAQQMAQVLHYPGPPERLHSQMSQMLQQMQIDQPGRKLSVANAIWVQSGFPLHAEYQQTLSRFYRAEPNKVDYVRQPDAAVAQINKWAEDNTAGKIKNLLVRADINDMTRLFLTNTVYFKADWLKPFQASATQQRQFRPSSGAAFQTAFMNQTNSFRYLDKGSFHAVELPYAGEDLSMMVFLPKEADGLGAFERQLTAPDLQGWIGELLQAQRRSIALALPKLKVEEKYQLKPQLQAMGMRRAFHETAQFQGISEHELFIYTVIHQTFLEMDEKGTEAAAATAIGMQLRSMVAQPLAFVADHPFFFLIRDNRNGSVLFMGRIEAPPAVQG